MLGAVAAAVVGVALLGGTALQSLSGQGAVSGGAEESADEASGARGESQAEAGQDRTAAAGTAPGHSGAAGAAEEREATATEGAGDGLEEGGGAGVEVAFADAATPVRGAGDVRARFAGAPPGLLRSAEPGVLAEIALRTSEQVRRAPPFSSGAAPGDCLPAVLAGTGAAVTRVETVLWRGRPALAYVLVGGTAGPADAEAVVAAVPGCAELARVPLEP